MITTQDVGQEGSGKAGEPRGLGLTVAEARAIWGLIVGYRNSGRIGAILGGTLQRVKEPGAHRPAPTTASGQDGLGRGQPDRTG